MNFKQELFLFYTFLLSLGAVCVRIVRLMFSTDPGTGYVASGNFATTALYIIAGLVVAMTILGFLFIKKREVFVVYNDTSHASLFGRLSIVLFIFALAFFTIVSVSDFLKNGINTSGTKGSSLVISSTLIMVASLLLFVNLFMMLFTNEKNRGTGYELSLLAPVLFSIIRLVDMFIKYTGEPNIPSRYLNILSLVAFLLFFVAYAKARTHRGSIKTMFLSALVAIFFSSLSAIPQLLLMRNFDSGVSAIKFIASFALDIAILIYVIAAVFPIWVRSPKPEVSQEVDYVEDAEDDEEYYEDEEEYEDEE